MTNPINLNRVRKARARAAERAQAAENRVRFGLSKPQRTTAERAEALAALRLDGHRRDDETD